MPLKSELTRTVAVEPWPREAIEIAFGTTHPERNALARRLGMIEVRELEASCRLDPNVLPGMLVCTGVIEAIVVQACVVSLEPLVRPLKATFERHLTKKSGLLPTRDELVDPDAVDVEAVNDNHLDVGELVVEELALALDPYPHADDAYAGLEHLGADVTFGEGAVRERPFASLAKLAR